MAEFFDWKYVQSFGVPVKGIIHIGAHMGQEAEEYSTITSNVVWFEAHPEYAQKLFKAIGPYGQAGYECAMSDVDDNEVEFFITADEVASSLLKPAYHQIEHPHAYLTGSIKILTHRFDTIWPTLGYDIKDFNALVLDTQGSEMKVMHGMGGYLNAFDIIATEYSTVEFYEGGARLEEIECFLAEFTRVYPDEPVMHGDALFVRNP